MKNFVSNHKHFLVFISVVLVLSILICCFAFIPASADAGNSFGMPDRYSRDSLANNGWIYKDSPYYVYCPIMSDGKKYERVNMNSPSPSATGLWTIDNWGLGKYNSTTQFYTYSKRIFFADTTRYYTSDYDFAKNFFVIPKGSSVRLSFVIHLTGQVQYYRDIYELCSLSLYTNQKYTSSDKYISYDTGLRTQNYYYGNNTQVFNGTNYSEWVIQTTFTAMDEDVYVNSLHLDMNALLWDASVLPLADSGKMFESFLIIELLDPDKDPIKYLSQKKFQDYLTGKFDDFMDAMGSIQEPIKNTAQDIVNGLTNVFDSLAYVPKWFVGVGTSVTDSISCFIAIVNGTHSLGG